ncbi:MAG: class I SAM-dependent rRNA methyltransferase [bacterium]
MKNIRIKRGQERRILEGYLWGFSNQIEDSVRDYNPGEVVRLSTRNGKFIGVGYVNPHSLIAVRILHQDDIEINTDFFLSRFGAARQLRQQIYGNEEAVREIYSESDYVPGLIVDRYLDNLVVSFNTAGMETHREAIINALQEVYKPAVIYEKSIGSSRKLEGLDENVGLISGDLPKTESWVQFAGIKLPVDLEKGQKTGLFLDQRLNIETIVPMVAKGKILDAFSYTGVWGLRAAKSGAAAVTFLDSSNWALEQAVKAAKQARLGKVCEVVNSDALQAFKAFAEQKQKFDVIFLDPPSFIRSKSSFKDGYRGYFDINQRAVDLLESGGLLVSSSCSYHMRPESFEELLKNVLRRKERSGRIIYKGRQAPDHPVLPAMPETEYLKCIAIQVD